MSFFTRLFNKGEAPEGSESSSSPEANADMPPQDPLKNNPAASSPAQQGSAPKQAAAPAKPPVPTQASRVALQNLARPAKGPPASGTPARAPERTTGKPDPKTDRKGVAVVSVGAAPRPPGKPASIPPPLPGTRPPSVRPPPPGAKPSGYSNPHTHDDADDTTVDRKPRSTRPAATNWDLGVTQKTPSIAETFESLLSEDMEDSLSGLEMRKGDSQRPGGKHHGHLPSSQLSDVRELFAELAASHMRQVRDFMIDVTWGEAVRDWIAVCEPAVRSLQRAAEKLELGELQGALDKYAATLEETAKSPDRTLSKETKDKLLDSYKTLLAILPQAFALDKDRTQRESIIVQSLLLQIPGVRKLTIDKLYAAGLTSFQVIFAARPDEVAATTGIALDLAHAIVERFQSYRRELRDSVPDAARSVERERLAKLTVDLEKLQRDYERNADGWSTEALSRKRQLRQTRDAVLLEVKVILARLGEVTRLATIDRLPYERKLGEIRSFLEEADRLAT